MRKLRSILFLVVVLAMTPAVAADGHSLADLVAGDAQFSTLLELADAAVWRMPWPLTAP